MMVTTIPNNTHNLTTLPHEILMLIATTPQDLCLLAQTSKVLSDVSSDDRVWKPIFLRYRKYAYNKKEHVTWKTATLGVNHARFEFEQVFARVWAFSTLRVRNSFQRGCDPAHLRALEENNGVLLPQTLKEYFMTVNGQSHLAYGEGFVRGARLLSIEEALTEYNHRKQKGQVLIDSAIGLPLAEGQGSTQLVASETTGAIYLESGWNVFNKAPNWAHYLCDVTGVVHPTTFL